MAVCPLAGRHAELRGFARALEQVGGGAGGLMVLRGDAGVGKSRLLDELASLSKARGALVLPGRAWAMHTHLAYALLVDALGPHLRSLKAADRERLVDDLPELDTLFVELRRRSLPPLRDPELEKTRLFEAFCRLVERLAESQPVLLALDDAHWADRASIEMLHYLCRNLRRSRILVALTVRTGEPEPNLALVELFHSLGQAGLLSFVDVAPLPDEDGLAMARLLLGGDLAPSLETIITSRTRGVPLLVEELVRSLLSTGQLRRELRWKADASAAEHLPNAVRELIRYRLARLDAVDRALLETLAVDGQGTRAAELAQACDVDPGERLDRLVRERFVTMDNGRFVLAHPLTQQALLDGLGASARQRLHLSLVQVLEKQGGDLGRLARHYVAAGAASPRALEVVSAAAAHWQEVHAHAEAAALQGAAVELARSLGRDEVLPELYERLGELQSANADPARAAQSWSQASHLYEQRGERKRSLALVPRIALARSTRGQNAEALELLRSAALGADADVGVHLAEAEVMIRNRIGDLETLDAAVDELRRLAAQLEQPAVAVTAKSTEAWICMSRVQCPKAWQLSEEALAAARAVGEPLAVFNILRERYFIAMSLGDIDAVEKNAIEAGEVARTQLRSAPLVSVAEVGRLAADWARSEWRRAAERVPQIFEACLRAGDKRFAIGSLYGQAQVAALSGDADQARMCLDEAKRQSAEWLGVVETRVEVQRLLAEGELKALQGDHAAAIAFFEEACGPLPGRLMRTEFPVYSLARLASAYVGADRLEDATRVAGYLDGGGPLAEAHAARIRGLCDPDGGVAHLERSLELLRSMQIHRETCEVSLVLAERLPPSRREEALALTREAAVIAERAGDGLSQKRVRACLQALGATTPGTTVARRRSSPEDPSLSAREREVAILIARGLTNDEIGRSLKISPHTVATHIKRMYERLGFASRVEVTRYVIDHHLGDD